MHWTAGVIVYVIIWWLLFFAILPFGVRGVHEGEDAVAGVDPGAPQNPALGMKALVTTGISAVVWLIVKYVIENDALGLKLF